MRMNNLGRTGLKVTELCLGTMTWGRQNTEDEAHAQIDYALDAGLNFMDTAEIYAIPPTKETYGKTESIIGNWFKKSGKRDKWILATKAAGGGSYWIRGGSVPGAKTLNEAVDGSLKRLQTDYVDLYQVHWPWRGHYHFESGWTFRPETQDKAKVEASLLEILQAMDALIKAGKVLHFGLSNESAWGICKWLQLADKHGLPRAASIQNEYNLLRRSFDHDLAELSHHEDVGLMAYSPLGAGVLSGKYLDGARPRGSRGDISNGMYRHNEYSEPAIRSYVNLAKDHGWDPNQMALAFVLSRPFTMSAILGATSIEQLKIDIAAADKPLDEETLGGIASLHRCYPRTL